MSHRVSRGLALVAVVFGVAAPAGAQAGVLRYDAARHGALAAAGFVGAGVIVFTERGQTPECRWCGIGSHQTPAAPRVDRWARWRWRWSNEDRADRLSYVTAAAAYAWPAVALGVVHGGTGGEWGRDQVVIASTLGMTQLGADLTKRIFRRARPAAVFDRAPIAKRDDAHSFVSGHAATSFAMAIAAGTIATRRGSPDALWIWTSGVGLAAATGYLRVASDRHFLTDVLGGAALGSAVGVLVPQLFDETRDSLQLAGPPVLQGFGPGIRIIRGGPPVTFRLGAGARAVGVTGSVGL